VTLDAIERTAVQAVLARAPDYGETLEALVAALIASSRGYTHRATDGLVILREELSETSYFAVGMVHLIEDQSRQPVAIELLFARGRDRLLSGAVRFGHAVTGERALREDKLENALIAYPRDAAAGLTWAFVFERSSNGWTLIRRPQNNKMQQTSHG
jgi:hypothetical protein